MKSFKKLIAVFCLLLCLNSVIGGSIFSSDNDSIILPLSEDAYGNQ